MPTKLCANCDHRATNHKRRRSEGGYARFECKECHAQGRICDEFRDPIFEAYKKRGNKDAE